MIVNPPSIDADIVQDGTTLRLGTDVGRTSAVEVGGTLTPTTFPGDVEILGEGGGGGGGAGLGPAKKYIISGAGQSNQYGWALADLSTDAVRLYPPNDRIWAWACWSGDPYYDRRALLVEPRQRLDRTGAVSGQTGYGICPGVARALLPQLQANEEILIVDYGVGDTGALESSDWLAPSGTLLANWIARTNAALASDPTCELWGFVWMQGERDVVLQRRAGNYAAALDAIVAAVRSGVTGASNVPFFICGMVPAWRAAPNSSSYSLSSTTADVLEVHLSHTSAPYRTGMERVVFVDGPSGSSAHNPGDPVHYRASAQQIIGASIVAARSTALANTTITAPGTPSVSVSPLTATTARVTIVPAGSTHGYFELDWQNDGAGSSWTSVSNTGAVLVRDITGLTSGLKNLRCRAGNRAGVSSYATTSWTQIELPSAPVLSYTDVTGNTVDLEWTASTGGTITGYEGRYRPSGGGAWTTFNPGNVLSYTLPGLTSGVTYEIEVRGVNANGPGPYSNTVTPTTGSAPTISSAGLGLPAASWTAHHVIYSLSGGSAGALVFEERALGSSGAWNPVTPTSADNAGAIIPVDPTADMEIRITGANTVTLTWTGMARPVHILDFANSTHSASSPFEMSSVPNLGSGTAWTNTGANGNRALYDATTFSGIPVAACSIDRRLFGPALPLGKWWTMVLIYKVNDLGYGNMVSQNASSALWLNGLGVANSRNLWYGDASPWNQVGPSSPGLTLNAWNAVTYVFDPGGGTNNVKGYINDTLALQGTRPERSQAGSGQIMNGFDTGSGPISSAGMQAYYAWVVQGQGSTINATQITQLRQALLRERGLA
jgi:hypothetical protein